MKRAASTSVLINQGSNKSGLFLATCSTNDKNVVNKKAYFSHNKLSILYKNRKLGWLK
jgi:hypothetical protein